MGVYDREYYRDDRPRGFFISSDRAMVTNLVLINFAVWIIDLFTPITPGGRWLTDHMAVNAETWRYPWEYWKFLTAGFAHAPLTIWHVGLNMLGLWFFGRDLESTYGRKEFLRFYLVAIVVANIVWVAVSNLMGDYIASEYGASGAVAAVVVVFAMMFPTRTFYFYFFLPVPAWLLAVLMILGDMAGLTNPHAPPVAYAAHLGGAAFGALYYLLGWRVSRIVPDWLSLERVQRKMRQMNGPKLRVHDPVPEEDDHDLRDKLDEVLEKYSRVGEAGLTRQERRFLEEASRKLRERRG